jgi:hypothetical protein
MWGNTRRRRRNERLQLTLLWLFGAGSLVIPALHAVDHHGDHVHIGGATVPLESTPGPADRSPPEGDDPNHAGGSLAHLTLAFAATPTFVVPRPTAEPIDCPSWTLPQAPLQPVLRTCRARAPPHS